MKIIFGPAGIGPTESAEKVLERYHKLGLKAAEIAFTYNVYIKPDDALRIGKKANELGISLSIHAPYFVNLNSKEKTKREATKKRILSCCRIGHLLGAKTVVFHPGYYSDKGKTEKDREETYQTVKEGIIEIMKEIKKEKLDIEIAPETMGKVNVFGTLEEISRLSRETGCFFCIDFAHILARYKEVDFAKIVSLFPKEKWHCHFSGIIYSDAGEKEHRSTKKEEWKTLLEGLRRYASEKEITIVNESPTLVDDSVEGMKLWEKTN
jgi:deoxyribonuclease-4